MSDTFALFFKTMMKACAAQRRKSLDAWIDVDVVLSIDVNTAQAGAACAAAQRKTFEDRQVTSADNRQAKSEDGVAKRAKAWRAQKPAEDENRPWPNAAESSRGIGNDLKSPEKQRIDKPEKKLDFGGTPWQLEPSRVRVKCDLNLKSSDLKAPKFIGHAARVASCEASSWS